MCLLVSLKRKKKCKTCNESVNLNDTVDKLINFLIFEGLLMGNMFAFFALLCFRCWKFEIRVRFFEAEKEKCQFGEKSEVFMVSSNWIKGNLDKTCGGTGSQR